MWKLPFFIISWLAFLAMEIPLILLGWLLIPIASYSKAFETRKSKFWDYDITAWKWPFMYLWGNEEDGIDAGDNYFDAGTQEKQIVYWSALRNPVCNLRFIPILSLKIDASKVKFIGSQTNINTYDTKIPQWFLAWQGFYGTFWYQFNLFGALRRFWIGWQIYPTDINGVTEYRKYGAGFTVEFKKV